MTAPAAIRHPTHLRLIAIGCLIVAASCVLGSAQSVQAATITASYEHGRDGVVINGYGTRAMGSFRLRDGDRTLLAWCLEADVPHVTQHDAYRSVSPSVDSAELDALLWWLDREDAIDADTAVAAAALTWFYAGARRSNGPPVWSDGSRAFAPISPVSPAPWDALAPFSLADPVGLIVPGTHLDAAERRVLELHRLAGAFAGPWELSIVTAGDRGSATVELRSPAGRLAHQVIEVVVEVPGSASLVRHATTADDGRAQIPLPDLPDGAVLRAAVTAPGPHQEWDGDGKVQRMATATSVPVRAVVELPPLPGHVEIHKRSSDPTIGVAGAVFVLIDRDGNEVGTATSGIDGVARFAPIDVGRHLPPYRVRESTAPPGLIVTDDAVEVRAASRDPVRPTVVEITNEPRTVPLALRKRLSIDDAGPDDLSGFSFEVRRRSDGGAHALVTGADGEAAPIDLPWGTYDVCEVGVPDWAAGLIDTGCRAVVLDASSQAGQGVLVDYVNEIPPPAVDTSLSGPTDGDRTAVAGDVEIIDRVALSGLIPGVRYTIDGEIVRPDDEQDPVIATGRAELVATTSTATIDVVFEIEGLAPGRVVATERITIGGVVVADHRDLDDPDQTLTVVPPTTTTTTTTSTTTTTTTTTTTVAPTSTIADSTTTTPATTVSAATTTVPAISPPVTTSSVSTLPRTGNGDATAGLLRLGDVGFVLGVALVALAGTAPRRHGRDEAGC